ncbi:hypothetical protein EMGBD1_20490 [Anaerolineaceae bacterium]|nr:hypothetical protein EMGBD1_20490 [Anaerolineaceae bacterium]
MSNSRNWNMFILLCLCLGSVFRLIWVQDMEYKGDEAWWFHKSQVIGRTEPIPMRGLISASGVDNPGMSLWIMAALAQGFGLDTPTSFVRAIQVGAILALVVLFLFARQRLSGAERQQWYWGGALASVNFTAVLFSRKLWPVELLPIFSIFFLMAWWQRRNFWGAFFWGLLGALLGQIQMSGFFYAAALFLWTALFNRKAVRWPAWVLGSAIGALPLIPWLAYIAAGESGQRGIDWNFHAPPIGEYFGYLWHFMRYGRDWFEYALGTSWVSSIGNHEAEFARYPIVGGYETYLVFAARTLLLAAFVYIGGRLLYVAGLRCVPNQQKLCAHQVAKVLAVSPNSAECVSYPIRIDRHGSLVHTWAHAKPILAGWFLGAPALLDCGVPAAVCLPGKPGIARFKIWREAAAWNVVRPSCGDSSLPLLHSCELRGTRRRL